MGGPERLDKHRGKGKLDARARIERLLDPGTFRELGTLVGGEIAADGLVVGSGSINGSPVMLGAEDFTTMAGSIGPGGNSSDTASPNWRCATDSAGDAARRRRLSSHRWALRAQPDRSARPSAVLGPGPDRRRRARTVGRTRRAGGSGVRLPDHE